VLSGENECVLLSPLLSQELPGAGRAAAEAQLVACCGALGCWVRSTVTEEAPWHAHHRVSEHGEMGRSKQGNR